MGEPLKGVGWSSLFSTSLGENEAPNGLGESARAFCGCCLALLIRSLMWLCDGGVDPEENFELKLDIHELRLEGIGLAEDLAEVEGWEEAFCDVTSFASVG